jgi:hypothetical protein
MGGLGLRLYFWNYWVQKFTATILIFVTDLTSYCLMCLLHLPVTIYRKWIKKVCLSKEICAFLLAFQEEPLVICMNWLHLIRLLSSVSDNIQIFWCVIKRLHLILLLSFVSHNIKIFYCVIMCHMNCWKVKW